MGSSKGNNTTTTSSSPNSDAMAAYQSLLARAGGVANTPYQAYGGELVAPVNQQQYQGIGNINQYAYSAQPAIQQAEGMATAAATPITAAQIQQYESPYTQQVVNATQAQFNNQNAQQMQGVKGNAIAQGALGGNREAIAEAETANQQQMAQAPVIANLQNQGYQTGLNTALTEQQALASGAYSLGNLGVSGQSAGLTGANAQIGAGTLEQQNQQALDQALYGQFQQAQAFPYQQAQWLAGLTSGIGSQMGGTSSTTGPPPSWMSQLGGLGMAGMGLFGQSGAMSGLGSLGSSAMSGLGSLGSSIGSYLPMLALAARGGRIKPRGIAHFDSGGGVAGMPYADAGATPWASGAGWIPGGMQLGHGAGIPHPPAAPQPQSAADLTKQVGSLAKMLGPGGNDSTFGGVNYNGVASGSDVSGSDMAQAAQAGVASGLQFNPMTGEVMARGGAVGVARHGYADGGAPDDDGPIGPPAPIPDVQGFGDQTPSWWSQLMGTDRPRAPAKSMEQFGPPNGFNVQGFGDDAPLPNPTTLAAAAGAPTEGVGPAAPDRPSGLPTSGDLGAMASLPFVNTGAAPTAPSQRPSWMGDVDPSGNISARGDAPLTSGIAPVAGVSGAWAGPDVAAPGLPPATAIAAPPGGVAPSSMADFLRDRASGRAVSRAGDLKPDFATRLTAAIQDAEDATGHRAKVSDFGRTYEEQADAYRRYQTGEGGLAAPPGHSRHQIGEAADISRGPVLDWLHANAGKYGLEFLPGHSGQVDPVHIQLARGQSGGDAAQTGVADSLPENATPVSGGRSIVNPHGIAPPSVPAQAPSSGIDWSSNGKLWPALTTAGFAMMASKSPFPGVAIGEGGLAGVGTYQGLQQQEANRDLKKSEIDLKVKQLAQQADIAQKHLDAQSRPYSEMTSYQKAELAQKQALLEQGKTPAGYRFNNGQLEAIPGGPADPQHIRESNDAKYASTLSDDAQEIKARQMINGDLSGLTNIGRGAQAGKTLESISNKAANLLMNEYGMTPAEAAKHISEQVQAFKAEQVGQSAGARTAATREKNLELILKNTAAAVPAALEASDNVWRTGFVPVNKVLQMAETAGSNTDLAKFRMANLQLAESWARAMNPTGVMRMDDRNKALELLGTATSADTYKALVGQLQTQITREYKSIKAPFDVNAASGATPAGGTFSNAGTGPAPTIKSKSEYDKLPSGASFIDGSGKSWTKP